MPSAPSFPLFAKELALSTVEGVGFHNSRPLPSFLSKPAVNLPLCFFADTH
jgi:hypothetical protein